MADSRVVRFAEAAEQKQQWRYVRHLSRWSRNRTLRRILTVAWIGLLAVDAKIAYTVVRLDATSAVYPTLTLFGLALWSFRRMDIGLAQPSLEDRAVIAYGEEFDELRETQRGEVFDQQIRDNILGKAQQDERERVLRSRSESAAYGVLRPALIVTVTAYWAVCLFGPFQQIRSVLCITAVVFTWFAVMVLVLPTMIRLWSDPDADDVGDLRIVSTEMQP